MPNTPQKVKDNIRTELESARKVFHTLLGSLSESDMQKKSHNPGWTNGEVLAHMTFGLIILNVLLPMARIWGHLPKWTSNFFTSLLDAFTIPFNWINALGARMQGHVFTYKRIGKLYDQVYLSLMRQIDSIKDNEWDHGMYYPTQWDSNFGEFMTIEELFHYSIRHFHFHLGQILK